MHLVMLGCAHVWADSSFRFWRSQFLTIQY